MLLEDAMSGDLISRKALEKSIRNYADEVGCNRGEYELANGILKSLTVINQQKTAYDVEKVVEQLNNRANEAEKEGLRDVKYAYMTASLLVKEGGV